MPDLKISQLPSATSAASADLFNIVQGGVNKRLTTANLFANINSPFHFNPDGGAVSLRMDSPNIDYLLFVSHTADKIGVATNNPAEVLDVNGNLNISGGFLRSTSSETLTPSGSQVSPISTSTSITKLLPIGGSPSGTLSDGVEGQIKHIFLCTNATGFTISSINGAGFSGLTFNSLGDSITLQYLVAGNAGRWYIVNNNGVAVS